MCLHGSTDLLQCQTIKFVNQLHTMNKSESIGGSEIEYKVPELLTRLTLMTVLLSACPPREPNGIRSCRLNDASFADDTRGYIRGTTNDGAVICTTFSQPSTPRPDCPYVTESDGFYYLHNFTAEQALTRRFPDGCPDVLAGFSRPCFTLVLNYRVQAVHDASVDGFHTFTTDAGTPYTLHGPAQIAWRAINNPDAGCIGAETIAPIQQNAGTVSIPMLDRTPSPSLLPLGDCIIDRDSSFETPGYLNDAGICIPFPGYQCDSGYTVPSTYAEDGTCAPYWGPMCDAGTAIASHWASDGACLSNPGESCDAGRGAPGYILLDGACARRDAGIDASGE